MSETAAVLRRAPPHPVNLVVTDDLVRSRLTVFFRLLLVIPCAIWLALWGIVAEIVLLIAWIVGAVHGTRPGRAALVPRRLHPLLDPRERVPAAAREPVARVRGLAPVPDRRRRSRRRRRRAGSAIFFRLLLAIPAIVLSYVFRLVNNIVAFLGWFYCLIFGRMNEGMRNLSAWLFRYELQTYAYIFLLTARYPSLEGSPKV